MTEQRDKKGRIALKPCVCGGKADTRFLPYIGQQILCIECGITLTRQLSDCGCDDFHNRWNAWVDMATQPKWTPYPENKPEVLIGNFLVSVEKHVLEARFFLDYGGSGSVWATYEGLDITDNVLAWSPMPEPWKGETK